MIKLLIADDHHFVREGLKMILSETEDIVVTAEASDGEEVLDKLKADNFDVMLLDMAMPRKSGLDVLREIKAQGDKIPVIMMSAYATDDYGQRAIKDGADGFLSKEDIPEKLIDAIRKVVQNK